MQIARATEALKAAAATTPTSLSAQQKNSNGIGIGMGMNLQGMGTGSVELGKVLFVHFPSVFVCLLFAR